MKSSPPAPQKLDASSSAPAKNYGFGTALSKHSLPKFKHVDEKKRMHKGHLQSRLANIKKKMEELCVLCDTKGFLICYSPSLGMETWPKNRSEILPLIHKYVESRNKLQHKTQDEGSEKKEHSLASLLAVVKQEPGERDKIHALIRLICGNRSIDGMNLREIREVIARTNSAIAALKRELASSALRGKGPKIEARPSEAAEMEDKGAKKEKNLIESLEKGVKKDEHSKKEELDLTLSL